jgi:hypothetical protein
MIWEIIRAFDCQTAKPFRKLKSLYINRSRTFPFSPRWRKGSLPWMVEERLQPSAAVKSFDELEFQFIHKANGKTTVSKEVLKQNKSRRK